MAQQVTQFPASISALAWRPDSKQLALASYNSCDIEVFDVPSAAGAEWTKSATLKGHEHPVAAIDWDHREHKLVSCGHDRNAFVWVHESSLTGTATPTAASSSTARHSLADDGYLPCTSPDAQGWHKQMVLTRLKRGCTCVRWSPCQRKMAVGGASKAVTVTFYDPALRLWSPKSCAKKHGSSITALAWHPDPAAHLLATASTDGCVRVMSAHVSEVDGTVASSTSSPFGPASFGTILCCVAPQPQPAPALPAVAGLPFDVSQQQQQHLPWVHCVAWTPKGAGLLWAAHNSTLHSATTPYLVSSAAQAKQAAAAAAEAAAEAAAAAESEGAEAAAAAPASVPDQATILPQHSVQLPGSPLKVLAVLGDGVAVGAGWDGVVVVLAQAKQQGGAAGPWELHSILGLGPPTATCTVTAAPTTASIDALGAKLASQLAVTAGGGAGKGTDWDLVMAGTDPAHTNLVTSLCTPLSSRAEPEQRRLPFSTAGLDGRMVLWDVGSLMA